MGRAVVLVDRGFQEAELLYPYYRLQEAGYKVDLVGPKAEATYVGEYGYRVRSNLAPEEVDINEVEAVIIPGGRAPDRMRTKKGMVDLVRAA
ncbi:MAG: DJ-1/PfpI family protein, partial [Candidatus Bathyarchaeota archaeon]|nr:DJ-1/PfpI family protein [Candidatus Bathyarchaeota archaeon]